MTFSLIVPIYNVSEYLPKCFASIQKQTFHDFEVILVNDGSTDGCGEICRQYAKDYTNTKAFDKRNGGLSDARNFGYTKSSGKYILFIDADDYIDDKLLSACYNQFKSNDSIDIVNYGYFNVDEKGSVLSRCVLKSCLKSGRDAMFEVLNDKLIGSFAWANAYKRGLFDDIEYPKGKLYEDKFTTFRLYEKAKIVSFCDKNLYYYVHRDGSICNSAGIKGVKGALDNIEALLYQYNYSNEIKNSEIGREIFYRIRDNIVSVLRTCYRYKYYAELQVLDCIINKFGLKNNKMEVVIYERAKWFYGLMMIGYRFVKG